MKSHFWQLRILEFLMAFLGFFFSLDVVGILGFSSKTFNGSSVISVTCVNDFVTLVNGFVTLVNDFVTFVNDFVTFVTFVVTMFS